MSGTEVLYRKGVGCEAIGISPFGQYLLEGLYPERTVVESGGGWRIPQERGTVVMGSVRTRSQEIARDRSTSRRMLY